MIQRTRNDQSLLFLAAVSFMTTAFLFPLLAQPQPIGVVSLKCTDASGNSKTQFTRHGDSATCTITFSSPAPAGMIITPYSADAPLVLSPAAANVPGGSVSVNVGGQQWAFLTPASSGFLVATGGMTTATFTVIWP